MKKIFQIIIIVLFPVGLYAQNDIDVLRYSQIQYGGTARSLSMGNAFGALGGDFSTLSINPAGAGLYRSTELTFTPTLFGQNSTSNYLGTSYKNSKYTFNFYNAGFVYSYDNEDDNGWSHFNFGFGYNRLADFSSRSNYSGLSQTSVSDYFIEVLNSGPGYTKSAAEDPNNSTSFDGGLGTQTGLLYYKSSTDTTHYTSDVEDARTRYGDKNVFLLTDRTVSRSGGMGEVVFTFASNYANKLYLGATLGFTSLSFNEQVTLNEKDHSDNISYFRDLTHSQNLSVSGTGINLKLGAILKATDWLRLGGYVHTPTVMDLEESYSTKLNVRFDSVLSSASASSPDGVNKYQIVTPARAGGSLGFVIMKKAVIGIDAEFVDYTSGNIKSDNNPYSTANTAIQNKYRSTVNTRLGAEYKIDEVFSIRCGYALYQSPFSSAISGLNTNTRVYSAGLGIRGSGYFIDLGYFLTESGEFILPYSLSSRPVDGASVKTSTNRLAVTVGFKF